MHNIYNIQYIYIYSHPDKVQSFRLFFLWDDSLGVPNQGLKALPVNGKRMT